MTQDLLVKVPQMGTFKAELDVIDEFEDKKLVKTWQGIYKEFTKREEGHYEETAEFRELPEEWKWEVGRESLPTSLRAVG